jgi:hypothetical protein
VGAIETLVSLSISKEKTKGSYFDVFTELVKMSPFFISVHMPLNRNQFFMHLLFLDSSYHLIYQLVGGSSATIAKAKSSLLAYYQYKNPWKLLIGGPGVEVDETVLCNRGIIRNPTFNEDEVADTVWILGIVEKYDKSKFFVVRIPDRKIETITRVIESKIGLCSILVRDGHPRYPGVARNPGLTHLVVNLFVGLLNNYGDHTNGIKNLWSQMKSVMSRQHGVQIEDMNIGLEEFIFRKRNSLLDEGFLKNLLYDYKTVFNIKIFLILQLFLSFFSIFYLHEPLPLGVDPILKKRRFLLMKWTETGKKYETTFFSKNHIFCPIKNSITYTALTNFICQIHLL